MSAATMPWVDGPARGNDPNQRGEIEVGDRYLVLVHCIAKGQPDFWDSCLIVATETGWDNADGDSWGAWDWSDVEYFIKLDKKALPRLEAAQGT